MENYSNVVRWGLPLAVVGYAIFLMVSDKDGSNRAMRSLDFDGGVRLEYRMGVSSTDASEVITPLKRKADLEQSKRAFYFRLRNFDLTENAVKTLDNDTIVVEVPDDKDVEDSLNRTGILTIREVLDKPFEAESVPLEAQKSLFKQRIVDDGKVKFLYYRLGPPLILATDIDYEKTKAKTAFPSANNPTIRYSVELHVVAAARPKLRAVTSKLYHKQMAICVDNEIYSAPKVMDKEIEIAEITGQFDGKEANKLANILSAGYLPASFELVSRRIMGPKFGAGLKAQAVKIVKFIGALIGLLFVLRYIHNVSLIAITAVSMTLFTGIFLILVMQGTLKFSSSTICAFVTLVGMSVDNLILVFEQFVCHVYTSSGTYGLREGSRGLCESYNKERGIIAAANLTTIVAICPILIIKGPASDLVYTMIFGIGVAYITTVVYAKILYSSETFIDVFDKCSPCGHSLLPMDVNLFSNGGRVAMAVIYLSCLLFSVGRFVESRPVLGVDLQGGSEISVMLDREVDAAVIGAVAHTFFGQRAEVYGLDKRQDAKAGGFLYVVRVPHSASASAEIQSDEQRKHYTGIETEVKTPENFVRTLASVPGCESASLSSVQSVGAIQLADNKRKVVGLSFLGAALLFGILWYLFGGMAALASMVALVTDTLICLGALSVFHIPLTIQMVACLLTMVGYSVNDSILLCGHMKDYFKQYGADGAKSMSLVLQPYSSRVVLTSLSTLFASGSLWLLGFTAIRDFGIVLSVGVFFGMLSSVTIVVYLSESSLRRNFGKR